MNTISQRIHYTVEQVPQVAQQLLELSKKFPIFAISGTLGAGKTTLVQEMLGKLGIEGVLTSPTFTYVNIYHAHSKTIYHFDLYRIKSVQEFLVAGFDEYIFDHSTISLIEWPEVIEPLLTQNVCFVTIDYGSENNSRIITINCKGRE